MGTQGEFFERPDSTLIHSEISDHPGSDDRTGDHPVADEPAAPEPSVAIDGNSSTIISQGRNITLESTTPHTRRTMKDLSIPKLYYSISEVSRLTGLEPYVLRYWETEFDDLRPQKNRAGNRIYSNRDIKLILRIKELLREERYTIEGAKAILRAERFSDSKAPEEIASTNDPAQIALPTEKLPSPQATLTLEEIRSMKAALMELRAVMK
jgi:DNA-binding transcriptional MerR regulator